MTYIGEDFIILPMDGWMNGGKLRIIIDTRGLLSQFDGKKKKFQIFSSSNRKTFSLLKTLLSLSSIFLQSLTLPISVLILRIFL